MRPARPHPRIPPTPCASPRRVCRRLRPVHRRAHRGDLAVHDRWRGAAANSTGATRRAIPDSFQNADRTSRAFPFSPAKPVPVIHPARRTAVPKRTSNTPSTESLAAGVAAGPWASSDTIFDADPFRPPSDCGSSVQTPTDEAVDTVFRQAA